MSVLKDIADRAGQPGSNEQLRDFTRGAERTMEAMLLRRRVHMNRALVGGPWRSPFCAWAAALGQGG